MKLDFRPAQSEDIEPLFTFNRELIDAYEDKSLIDYGRVLAWVRRKLEQRLDEYTCVWAAASWNSALTNTPASGQAGKRRATSIFTPWTGKSWSWTIYTFSPLSGGAA